VLPVGAAPPSAVGNPEPARIGPGTGADAGTAVRVRLGPRADWVTTDSVERLLSSAWTVSDRSNRVGLRLDGAPLDRAVPGEELPSEGTVAGAVQVPADGLPVIFLADHPVTGGYPVVAVVRDVDLDVLAQVRPGERIRLVLDGGAPRGPGHDRGDGRPKCLAPGGRERHDGAVAPAEGRRGGVPMTGRTTPWLPAGFAHPERLDLPTGHHLRPIRGDDVDIDYPAVMRSRERLWSIYGEAWGWPPATMTYEEDREDLAHHEAEIAAHLSFNYALLDAEESALLGCVYLDPPEKAGADVEVSWWVVDELVGTEVEAELDRTVPQWLAREWPFTQPRVIGRDVPWAEWLAMPDVEND
jgi:hypothetical protein